MIVKRSRLLVFVLLVGSITVVADEVELVVCAPGYPGSTEEAQSAMDDLAAAVSAAAGWEPGSFDAVYFETEEDGVARLESPDAGVALVTLPFFLEHRESLDLEAEMLAVPTGRNAEEPWTLVIGRGSADSPDDLDGWTIVSLAGHSERFVRGPALGEWGPLPESVTIRFSGAVLSSLRRAAKGENIAVLLDAEQTAALDRLPFADDLEVIHRSAPLPVSVVSFVGDRVASPTRSKLAEALVELDDEEALAGVRLERFEPMAGESLTRAEAAFAGVAE
jgi:hypothetical protein